MKQQLLAGLTALGLGIASTAPGADFLWQTPQALYVIPPQDGQIDATNIFNPAGFVFEYLEGITAFTSSHTLNLTNRGAMAFVPGIDFQWYPATTGEGSQHPAANFVNVSDGAIGGLIEAQGIVTTIDGNGLAPGTTAQVRVTATNIVNTGTILADPFGLVRLVGNDVDLTQGTISVSDYLGTLALDGYAWLDGYWGLGGTTSNTLSPLSLVSGITPAHAITNRNYSVNRFNQLVLPTAKTYVNTFFVNQSNTITQIVFLSEPNPAFATSVFFEDFAGIDVQWQWSVTNWPSGTVDTNNYLVISDNFGEVTNLQIFPRGGSRPNSTYMPFNFNLFLQSTPFPGTAAGITDPTSALSPAVAGPFVTNNYSAYQAIFTPGTGLVSDLPSSNPTNMAGRIELQASDTLNLSNAVLTSPNYVLLSATNNLIGNQTAQIVTPTADFYLRTTNGTFEVTNFLAPYVSHLTGPVDLWSARWTNIDSTGFTNSYHVLFVESTLSTVTIPQVQTLNLTAGNVASSNTFGDIFISDVLNVVSNMTLNARSVTITTNPGSMNPFGQLNLLGGNVLLPSAMPYLQALTNWGIIDVSNTAYFAESPFNILSTTKNPLKAFVNHGEIFDFGNFVWSTYFENSGFIQSIVGSISLQQAVVGYITNSILVASLGDINLDCDNLLVSNDLFLAGSRILLNNSDILEDGIPNIATLPLTNQLTATVTNGNSWTCAGLALQSKPALGDLLGTTITSTAGTNQINQIIWAGTDLGPTNAGFFNNTGVGRLILDGAQQSKFKFTAPSPFGNYALYVDYLELRNAATNTDKLGNYSALQFDPNIKVYFAQAVNNGFSIAEKLAGLFATNPPNGGHLIWLSNYNYGYFSSTNIVYPDGTTNRVNAALAQSPDLDTQFPPHPIWTPGGANVFPLPPPPDPPAAVTNSLELAGMPVINPPAVSADSSNTVAGTYYGLFSDSSNGVSVASAGYVSINVTARSNYTAKVLLGGKSFSFSGSLATGTSKKTVLPKVGGRLTVVLQQSGSDQIHGSISGVGWSSDLLADRLVFSRGKNPATNANYTLVLPPDTNSVSGPAGYGVATVKLDAGGRVQWAGTLADGTKASQSTALSEDGYIPVYASLYRGNGLLIGWLQITNQPGSDLSGTIAWLKPRGAIVKMFSHSFTNDVEAFGSVYKFQPGTPVLPLSSGSLGLTGGSLGSNSLNSAFTLDSHNKASSSANKLKLNFKPTTGLFSGSVVDPVQGKFTYQGVVLQGTTNGFGFFLDSDESGEVDLTPAP